MGLWDRLRRTEEPPSKALALEDEGRLEEAATLYERGGHPLHAIRVMLALVDAEPDPRVRVRLLAKAARIGQGTIETPKELRVRYAKARLDMAARAPSSALLPSELSALGNELSEEGEHLAAAEAFRLAGDAEGAAGAFAEAGEIERLEGVLDGENDRVRGERNRGSSLSQLLSLEAAGQRLAAIELALAAPASGSEELRRAASRITATLVRGPIVELEVDGELARFVMGEEVVLGRVDAPLTITSPLVSRQHLRFHRDAAGAIFVEDLHTRNGTFLAGARLEGAVEIASPTTLSIGHEIPLNLALDPTGGLTLEVGALHYRLPLGPARVAAWSMSMSARGVRLSAIDGGPAPLLGGTIAASEGVDLTVGDTVSEVRGGAIRLRVRA